MRLIDADEASATLKALLYETAINNDGQFADACVEIAENRVEIWIGLVPTVDPVKHGRWISLNDQIAKCSSCGAMESTFGKDRTGHALIHKAIKHYCPNCGAKMDEVDT